VSRAVCDSSHSCDVDTHVDTQDHTHIIITYSRLLSHSQEDDNMWSFTEVAALRSLTTSLLTSKAVEGVCGGLRLCYMDGRFA
jgi:hypothetical protein